MPYTLTDPAAIKAAGFDDIIDVRSPAEYAEDHIPGAISLPVLSNAERAEVGTIYTQESPFKARKIGAALVARNAARHIEQTLMNRDGGWRPLVYCWRGGQRSGSFVSILSQIGWRAETLDGGYRSYRRHVVERLYDTLLPHKIIRLDGYTGTAKTALLAEVAKLGGQVIDLEGLANHRGSILGDVAGEQPSQKGFETAVLTQIASLDPTRPVLVEAESARIGTLRLPPALWAAMKDSPRLVITVPLEARAAYLATAYADLAADQDALATRLKVLAPLVGHETVTDWLTLLSSGQTEALAHALITQHYDPAYARLRSKDDSRLLGRLDLPDLSPQTLRATADRLLKHL
ncbi:MAG: tRNA 2-selenouridine(34) synthase MnmH [Pseudomonadota bacterium]